MIVGIHYTVPASENMPARAGYVELDITRADIATAQRAIRRSVTTRATVTRVTTPGGAV